MVDSPQVALCRAAVGPTVAGIGVPLSERDMLEVGLDWGMPEVGPDWGMPEIGPDWGMPEVGLDWGMPEIDPDWGMVSAAIVPAVMEEYIPSYH